MGLARPGRDWGIAVILEVETMIKDDILTWLGGAIVIAIYVAIVFSPAGCASNDPQPPIQTYRALHGFPA
jgi:hypothetical protein